MKMFVLQTCKTCKKKDSCDEKEKEKVFKCEDWEME